MAFLRKLTSGVRPFHGFIDTRGKGAQSIVHFGHDTLIECDAAIKTVLYDERNHVNFTIWLRQNHVSAFCAMFCHRSRQFQHAVNGMFL